MRSTATASAVPAMEPVEAPAYAPARKSGVVLAKPTVGPTLAAGGAAKFADNGGPVIEIARVQLVYWGSARASNPPPTPSANQVTGAVENMLSGSYMTGLAQYRQIGRGYLLGATVYGASKIGRASCRECVEIVR